MCSCCILYSLYWQYVSSGKLKNHPSLRRKGGSESMHVFADKYFLIACSSIPSLRFLLSALNTLFHFLQISFTTTLRNHLVIIRFIFTLRKSYNSKIMTLSHFQTFIIRRKTFTLNSKNERKISSFFLFSKNYSMLLFNVQILLTNQQCEQRH